VADWGTISSLATAGATLILALATFASVRSARRAAVATERALLAGIRPVLVPGRQDDPTQKVGFADDHWVHVDGGRAVAEATADAIYFSINLRNQPPEEFRRLTRDIYVPAGDVGIWQGAYRDAADATFTAARDAIEERRTITIDLLYGDHEGDQRTVSRFVLAPGDDNQWLASVSRHWNLDRADPR